MNEIYDPVFYDSKAFDEMRDPGGWYYWDDDQITCYGPFATEAIAWSEYKKYLKKGHGTQ